MIGKRFLKVVAGLIGSILILVLALACLIWEFPGLVINSHALQAAAELARKHGVINAQWSTAEVKARSSSFFQKHVDLRFQDLCVRTPDQHLDACFSRVEASFTIGLFHWRPHVFELGPLRISGGKILATLTPTAPEKSPPSPSNTPSGGGPLQWFRGTRMHPISIAVDSFEFRQAENRYQGQTSLFTVGDSQKMRGALRINAQRWSGKNLAGSIIGGVQFTALSLLEPERASGQLASQLTVSRKGGTLVTDLQGRLAGFPAGVTDLGRLVGELDARINARHWPLAPDQALTGRLDLKASASQDRGQLETRVSARLASHDHVSRGQARLQATMARLSRLDGLHMNLSALGTNLPPGISQAWITGCELELSRTGAPAMPGALKLDCPVYSQIPVPPQGFPDLRLPARAGARIRADLKTGHYPPDPESLVDGKLRVELEPILSPYFRGEGHLETNLKGIPSQYPRAWNTDTQVALEVAVPRFEKLVHDLAKGAWAVPAPLQVLKGTVALRVRGTVDLAHESLPIELSTRLASARQHFDLDGSGTFTLPLSQPPRLDFKLLLSNVALELPKLELGAPPRLLPDSRYVFGPPKPSEKPGESTSSLAYRIQIQTPTDHPARILSNLAQAPIPVNINLALVSDQPLGGTISVARFPVKLFRRDASVDHFTLTFADPIGTSPINGAVNVAYTDYTISILILSTIDKPTIKLTSNPPLPDDQLWSALLFGAPLDELNSDQSQSVGNTRAGVANGAVNLLSLYALASTPVQSVGYDPTTGAFTAKLRIAEGTSLNVGASSEGGQEVGLRKRIGANWTIETSLQHQLSPSTGLFPTTSSAQTASAYLEWNRRY